MSNYLFVITGSSGCGKTTLLKKMELGQNSWKRSFWEKAEKHSTRHPRSGEKEAGGYSDVKTPPYIENEPLAAGVEKRQAKRDEIVSNCDVIYYMNNELYGFDTKKILEQLKRGHVAIVLSDISVIKMLKTNADFGLCDHIVIVYISSSVERTDLTEVWHSRYKNFKEENNNGHFSPLAQTPKDIDSVLKKYEEDVDALKNITLTNDETGYKNLLNAYKALQSVIESQNNLMPDSESYKIRVDRLKNFYYKYIVEIGLFDYVVLNYFDKRDPNPGDEKMTLQMKNIIDYLCPENDKVPINPIILGAKSRPKDAVFVVCAAPRSGKNILMKNLHIMSEKQVVVISKQGLREPKPSDNKEDKMQPIIEKNSIRPESDAEFRDRKTRIAQFREKDRAAYPQIENSLACLKSALTITLADIETAQNNDLSNALRGRYTELDNGINKAEAEKLNLLNEASVFFGDKFKDWIWRFHGTYYGVNTKEIDDHGEDPQKKDRDGTTPVIMIANMHQLEEAIKRYGKRVVPIFLVFVGNKQSHTSYHHDLLEKGQYCPR